MSEFKGYEGFSVPLGASIAETKALVSAFLTDKAWQIVGESVSYYGLTGTNCTNPGPAMDNMASVNMGGFATSGGIMTVKLKTAAIINSYDIFGSNTAANPNSEGLKSWTLEYADVE